jgi:hypothetical protein
MAASFLCRHNEIKTEFEDDYNWLAIKGSVDRPDTGWKPMLHCAPDQQANQKLILTPPFGSSAVAGPTGKPRRRAEPRPTEPVPSTLTLPLVCSVSSVKSVVSTPGHFL